jgi:hypothetical protein
MILLLNMLCHGIGRQGLWRIYCVACQRACSTAFNGRLAALVRSRGRRDGCQGEKIGKLGTGRLCFGRADPDSERAGEVVSTI